MESVAIAPNRVLLGKYLIEEVLGRGGMGVVVRARHVTLGEVVAIKLLADDMALTQETFARFEREAKAAARLKSEHVVRVHDVGRLDDGMPYMVMELLDGRDLSQLVKAEGALAPSVAANLTIQVCEVLSEAHAFGIVHRDMKPSNVFVITRDTGLPFVKVLDFGIAKAPEADGHALTRTSSMLGTPHYMSPEQLRSSRSVDARSDIWALGVLLYEVIEGQRPFASDSVFELCFQIGDNDPPPMRRAPPEIAAIVMRCLEKDPAARYQSALELATALAPFAADRTAARLDLDRIERVAARASGKELPTPAPHVEGRFVATASISPKDLGTAPTQPSTKLEKPVRRRRWPWVIAAVTVAAAAAAVIVIEQQPADTGAAPAIATHAPEHVVVPATDHAVVPPTASPPVATDHVAPPATTDHAVVQPPPIATSVPPPAATDHVVSPPVAADPPKAHPHHVAPTHHAVTAPPPPPPVEAKGSGSATSPCDDSFSNRHGC